MEKRSAAAQVLNTPAILEMILIKLDMRMLLISQRVCRTWANLIGKSPSLQKALFFTPIKTPFWRRKKKTLNPLLIETFPSLFPPKDKDNHHNVAFSNLAMTKDASTMARFVRKEASWRKMLVQQPPISGGIGLYHTLQSRKLERSESSSISVDKDMHKAGYPGLRMERLFELLLFDSQAEFFMWNSVRVYWSTENPIPFKDSHYSWTVNNNFHKLMRKFGVVLYTKDIIQCRLGPHTPSAEEVTRREIIAAYDEHGLDAGFRRKVIEYSKGKVSKYRGIGVIDILWLIWRSFRRRYFGGE